MMNNQGFNDNSYNNQNDINSHAIFNKLMNYIETNDFTNLQDLMTKCPLSITTKNILLNKAMLLYLRTNMNNKKIISLLLTFKANPSLKVRFKSNNKDSNNDVYAFFIAVESNDIDLAKIFLDNGALINTKDNLSRNCLYYLLKGQSANEIKSLCSELIKRGVNVNEVDYNGYTPLMDAINKSRIEIVELLLQAKADVNKINYKDGNTAVHYAIMNSNKIILQKLMYYKPDICIKNMNNESPIDIIRRTQKGSEMLSVLLSNTLPQDTTSNVNGIYGKAGKNKHENNNKDSVFIFPKENISSRVEIPISFQDTQSEQSLNNNNENCINGNNSNSIQLHSIIKMQSTPVLHIDISNEDSQDKFICEGFKSEISNLSKIINKYEESIANINTENDKLKRELIALKEDKLRNEREIAELCELGGNKDQEYRIEANEYKMKLSHQDTTYSHLQCQFEQLKETKAKTVPSEEYNLKKYCTDELEDNYIHQMLTKDLNDFNVLVKRIMSNRKSIIDHEHIIFSFQDLLNSIGFEGTIKPYGSYATGLCMEWSNLDLIIIPNNLNVPINKITLLQTILKKLSTMHLVSSYKMIETYTQILHIETGEQYKNLQISISVFNYSHPGLKCIELTNQLLKDYNALEPLLITTKQIFRISNLMPLPTNSLNSYSLMIMIVYFLQVCLIEGKNISITEENNLGKLFFEMLKFYAMSFEYSQKMIYVFIDKNDVKPQDNLVILNNQSSSSSKEQEVIIIVDPLNNEINIALELFSVRLIFLIGYYVSKDNCECSCHYANGVGADCCFQDKEHCILNKIFKTVKRFKKQSLK